MRLPLRDAAIVVGVQEITSGNGIEGIAAFGLGFRGRRRQTAHGREPQGKDWRKNIPHAVEIHTNPKRERGRDTARGWKCTVRSPAFRRFFARIPAKAGTTNIGHFFPRGISQSLAGASG